MNESAEVTITGCEYWADHVDQLLPLLIGAESNDISAPATPGGDVTVMLTEPTSWANQPDELHDALLFALATKTSTRTPGLAPVDERLVYTVEEAAKLLGISRAYAYEAVKRGEIPSMRFGRRILVPKAALERFLNTPKG